ncbi:MAG: tRNA pseudouridine(13) synthase TruD [Halobacteriota archaeon]
MNRDDAADVGLDWYVSDPPGAGGELKTRPEDFRVEEQSTFSYGDTGRYAVLRVTLRNRDTHRFARDLSNALGVSRRRVRWAGTKDRRAVTTQLYTVDVADEDVGSIDVEGAEIELLGRADHSIGLGDLRGNRFEVVARDVERPGELERVDRELDERDGPANLYGSQRFGSRRPISHDVGRHVLRDDFEAAVEAYVGAPGAGEPTRTARARERYREQRDPKEALDYYPGHLGYEKALLNAVVAGDSHREAFGRLPHNLRRMFVNAVQSQAFNLVVRERYREGLGLRTAHEGDVVCFVSDGVPDVDRLQRVTESNVDAVQRHVDRGRAHVTAPLVGSDTELSEGEQGEIERDVLEDLGLEARDFDRDDEYGSRGSRRPIALDVDVERLVEDDVARFEFALPSGSYATVVLREYLKNDLTAAVPPDAA